MCHVLIIEDEILVAWDIERLLRSAGATSIAHAETEDQAVGSARDHRPAVITSDVNLRAGTGPSAVSRIRDEHGDVPALYITATPEDCDGCPPHLVFPKPLDEMRVRHAFLTLAAI